MLTHLSLFSGIGGLDLAAGMAGIVTIGQCEWADYQTKILEKHWPDVPRWKDIKTLTLQSFTEETYMAAHRKDYDQAVTMYENGFSIEKIADYFPQLYKELKINGVSEWEDPSTKGKDGTRRIASKRFGIPTKSRITDKLTITHRGRNELLKV